MKKVALAIATILTAAAPAAFAQDRTWNTPQDPYYQSRDQNRDWREENREYNRDREYNRANDYSRTSEYNRPSEYNRTNDYRTYDATPAYSESRQECFNPRAGVYEEVRTENKTRIGKGAAIGAVAGGVIGHQVDSGGGTAAGAILGGILGHQLERRNDRNDQNDLDFSRCRTVG